MSDLSLSLTNELGTELLKQAIETRKKKLAERCIGEVESVLSLIDITKQRIDEQESRMKVYRARLKAIESGEVSMVPHAVANQMVIVYNEESLRPEKVGF